VGHTCQIKLNKESLKTLIKLKLQLLEPAKLALLLYVVSFSIFYITVSKWLEFRYLKLATSQQTGRYVIYHVRVQVS